MSPPRRWFGSALVRLQRLHRDARRLGRVLGHALYRLALRKLRLASGTSSPLGRRAMSTIAWQRHVHLSGSHYSTAPRRSL